MACNSCAKPFSLLRKEKGCPGCGFSYCSKCLNNIVFLPKLKTEAKVCAKCKRSPPSNEIKEIVPPDAYYKRVAGMSSEHFNSCPHNSKDEEISQRLQSLKEGRSEIAVSESITDNIAKRLQAIKGNVPLVSEEELQLRLAKLKGQPTPGVAQGKPALPASNAKTDQEQVDDLLKQYMEQTKIDSTYKDGFNDIINDIESRIQKLKGSSKPQPSAQSQLNIESEDEEEIVKKIIQKAKEESLLDDNGVPNETSDELPFCEICNEDATLRCLGCKYLFCKTCFMEHKDDDDGCDKYEPYKPPNNN